MKITADELHKNKELQRRFNGVKIFLDGIEMNNVVVADQSMGHIDKIVFNANGKPKLNKSRDEVLTGRLFGKVEFLFKELGCD